MAGYFPSGPVRTSLTYLTHRFLYWTCGIILLIMIIIVGLVCGLVFGLHANAHASKVDLTVNLEYSSYIGSNAPQGVSQWLGIRYAAAPVGDLRFRAPQDPVADNKVYTADTVGFPFASASHVLTFDSTALSAIQVPQRVWTRATLRIVYFWMCTPQQ